MAHLGDERGSPSQCKLIIVCGLSFAGKTTLAKAIADRCGHEQVDVDDMKDQLYGPDSRDEDLGHADWVRIYDDTDSQIESYLKSGKSVVDASRYFTKAERERARKVADGVGANVITIFVDTPREVVHLRLLENRRRPSRRDVSDDGFQEILNGMEPPGPDEDPLIFHYGDEISGWISNNNWSIS